MNPEAWRQISEAFSDCLKLSAEDREGFLANLENTQPDIAREVRELLTVYDQDQAFLEKPGLDQITSWEAGTAVDPQKIPVKHWFDHRPTAFWVLLAVNIIALGIYVFGAVLIYRFGPVTTTMGWDADLDRAAGKSTGWMSLAQRQTS